MSEAEGAMHVIMSFSGRFPQQRLLVAEAKPMDSAALATTLHSSLSAPPTKSSSVHARVDILRGHTSGYQLHPGVGDSILHLATAIQKPNRSILLRVPSSFGSVLMSSSSPGTTWPLATQVVPHF